MNFLQSKKGFTLVEVLIVVAIVGILASFAIVGIGPVQKRGRDARRLSDLRQIQNGLELYFQKNGAYPLGGGYATMAGLLKSNGITQLVPNDPLSNAAKTYWYTTDSGGTTYMLAARLEDTGNSAFNGALVTASTTLGVGDTFPAACNSAYDSGKIYCLSL